MVDTEGSTMPVEELTDEELDQAFEQIQEMRDTLAEIDSRLTALDSGLTALKERTKPA